MGDGGGPLAGLMQLFGNLAGGAGAGARAGGGGGLPNGQAAPRWAAQDDDPGDPDEEVAGGGAHAQRQGEGQVPLRNLATFLGEAFGAPQPHPADHARNNPFAEGGHDDDDDPAEAQAQAHPPNDPFAALAAAAGAGGGGGGGGGGLNYLVTLLNAFGGGPLVGNRGDYAFGEGNFQQILNDLMEQAAGRAGPQPATKEIIDNLPRRIVDQEYLDSPSNHDCVICQDPYHLSDTLLTLPCKFSHAFHVDCIVPWLENSGTCPTCRFPLVPQPVDGVLPQQEEGAAEPRDGGAEREREGEDQAEGSSSGAGEGAQMSGSLPGSWPVQQDEAERTRARSRNRERAQRERGEGDELPYVEDLD
ncbi:hypothetical protein BCR35DRAFT_298857 [Leucosporidium creatinivorum]|uniref:RING-type domain-containing protein n=1 Tax=Leucosporidium creatinivorum TaxID=106004 RepID=A0A1Y2G498_9BASI|nr:hypothetical protein BCR35DRAFT_298857 [Leucosporidium creatinivorum]